MHGKIRERSIDEMRVRLASMQTPLNKIYYLEGALKETGFTYEHKRFLLGELSVQYVERSMFEKAAKTLSAKALIEVSPRDKIDSFVSAAELYARAGKVEEADHALVLASREVQGDALAQIKLARKNIFFSFAEQLEKQGKRAGAVKFYERLAKSTLAEGEKQIVRDKLRQLYGSLGMFRELRMLEGAP